MPQVDCYLCEDDIIAIGDFVFLHHAMIVPSIHYSRPTPTVVQDQSSFRDVLQREQPRLLHIISNKWQRSTLVFDSFDKGAGEVFYLSQKNGGPTIDVFFTKPIPVAGGQRAIGPGFIGHHASFWNPETSRMEKPPEELRLFYKELRMLISKNAKKIRYTARTMLVTENTRRKWGYILDLSGAPKEKKAISVFEGTYGTQACRPS